MKIGENLRRIRKANGLSQDALADLIGSSQQLISQIERGENSSTKNLPALAQALSCAVEDIDPNYAIRKNDEDRKDDEERSILMKKIEIIVGREDEAELRRLEDYLDFLLSNRKTPDNSSQ